jgi:hypothetical protein
MIDPLPFLPVKLRGRRSRRARPQGRVFCCWASARGQRTASAGVCIGMAGAGGGRGSARWRLACRSRPGVDWVLSCLAAIVELVGLIPGQPGGIWLCFFGQARAWPQDLRHHMPGIAAPPPRPTTAAAAQARRKPTLQPRFSCNVNASHSRSETQASPTNCRASTCI